MSEILDRIERIGFGRGFRIGYKRGFRRSYRRGFKRGYRRAVKRGEDIIAAVARIYIRMKPAGTSDEEIADVVANQLNCSKKKALHRVRMLSA